jgi:CubicO group peptidase (beta-lactamase class C family)
MKRLAIVLVALMMAGCTGIADAPGPAPSMGNEIGMLDAQVVEEVQRLFEESGIPSLAVAVVVGDEVIWARGFGEQDDLATIYMAGSIDKPFLTTAFLQMVEEGGIGLDDDINDFLPFEVRNPYAPEVAITPRMLLANTSGIVHDVPGVRYIDNDGPMNWWLFRNHGWKFGDLWYSVIPYPKKRDEVVGAALTDDSGEAWVGPPIETWQYSNTGFYDVLGRMMGEIEGGTYQDVIRQRVIEPLELENTSFEASAFPEEQLAVPYERFDDGYRALPLTGISASGRLRTNIIDLARFMALHMNEGSLDGVQILSLESIEQMHAKAVDLSGPDFPSNYLRGNGWGWQLWQPGLQGHTGAIPGFIAQMVYGEVQGIPFGVVLLMNAGCSTVQADFDWLGDYFSAIKDLLLEAAEAVALTE